MKRLILSVLLALFTISAVVYAPPQDALSSQVAVSDAPESGCEASTTGSMIIYTRPSTQAEVFFISPPGFSVQISARTASGWLGFNPGVAQAANMGSFRLRWVQRKAVRLSGNCSNLPRVWGPPPGICFDMPMFNVNVYEHPRTSARVLTVLHPEQFAAVVRRSGPDWVKVDLRKGNTGLKLSGWVEANTLNVNGPCRF
jgi:hypothetical protein